MCSAVILNGRRMRREREISTMFEYERIIKTGRSFDMLPFFCNDAVCNFSVRDMFFLFLFLSFFGELGVRGKNVFFLRRLCMAPSL